MMRFHFTNIKCLLYKIIALAFLSVMMSNNCAAQSVEPLPHSVKALEDTVVSSDVSESDSQKTNIVIPDTAVLRSVPDSVIKRYKKDKDFAYANDAAYWAKEPVSNDKNFLGYFWDLITSKGVKVFAYLLIISVLLFAFFKIVVDNKLYLFYSPPRKLVAAETNEVDLESEDVDERINEAMIRMDYRHAIRWMHLKALRLLNEKEIIRFHADGTNQEYLAQFSNHKQSRNFQYLTHAYDYAWYGGFALTKQQAETLQQKFDQFYLAIES